MKSSFFLSFFFCPCEMERKTEEKIKSKEMKKKIKLSFGWWALLFFCKALDGKVEKAFLFIAIADDDDDDAHAFSQFSISCFYYSIRGVENCSQR